ncbi:aspartic peptidase domain-containing protein [Lanmaoa asiatica]|nr:aspartic peptidase domain-containing protein [Lanmaoa asiatica]
MRLSSFLPFALLALATRGGATHLQLSGQLGSTSHDLERRTSMTGTLSQLGDSQNMVYLTNVTLNGAPFCIMIDTGRYVPFHNERLPLLIVPRRISSDLWVSSPVPGAVPQNYQAMLHVLLNGILLKAFNKHQAMLCPLSWILLDFLSSRSFLVSQIHTRFNHVSSSSTVEAPQGDAAAGADGLIGLGPSSGSDIRALGGSAAANPPLDRIFTTDTSVSPLIAILLQRSDDPEEPYPGDLAIGEVLTDHQDIFNQPRLPVTIAPLAGGQHWQTLLDVNGIIGPNGKPIQIKSQVTGAQTQNATVIFDTGFTLPQVPPYVAQALYGNIPGAVLTNLSAIGEIWVLPCDQEVKATFLFGGVEFPIHPLDLNFDGFDLQANGKSYCVGAFQPYSFDIVEQNEILFDMVLGMAFLRNSYMLINFGNLVNAATPSTDTAYIQLLPITNATQAAQDFANVRNGTGSATGDEIGKLFSSSSPSGSKSKSLMAPWLIGLIAGIGLLLILLITGIACCCRRRRIKNASVHDTVWVANPPSYRPIYEPSPQAAYDIHMAPGAPPGYTPAYVPEYKTAWDARY